MPFNPFSAGFVADPYAAYRQLQRGHRILPVRGCLGTDWVLSGYRDIHRALNDPRLVADDLPARIRGLARADAAAASVETLCATIDDWLFFQNPPEHTTVRHTLGRHFSRSALAWVPARVQALVDARLADVRSGDSLDLVDTLARPLPALVTRELLSLDGLDVDRLTPWSSALFEVFVQPMPLRRYQEMERSVIEFREYLTAAAGHSRPAGAVHAGCPLAAADFRHVSLLTMLFSVGQDTTQHLIGNVLLPLLQAPDLLERIRAERWLLPKAIKELARYDTPVQLVVRVAREDVTIGEWTIQRGDRVHLLIGAANRDAEVFAEPDAIDFDRHESNTLLFGAGIHVCLGLHLALLVAGAVVERLLDRFERLQLVPGGARRARSVHMRGLDTLWCRVVS